MGDPVVPAPLADGGYDLSDSCDIDPVFGTLAEAELLLTELQRRSAARRSTPESLAGALTRHDGPADVLDFQRGSAVRCVVDLSA